MKIKTNNHLRDLYTNEDGNLCFIYKGEEYSLDDFLISDSIPNFEAVMGLSYSSCIAIRCVNNDSVVVAYVHW